MNESFVDSINLKETGYNRIMAEEFFVWLKHEIVKVKRHKGPRALSTWTPSTSFLQSKI